MTPGLDVTRSNPVWARFSRDVHFSYTLREKWYGQGILVVRICFTIYVKLIDMSIPEVLVYHVSKKFAEF